MTYVLEWRLESGSNPDRGRFIVLLDYKLYSRRPATGIPSRGATETGISSGQMSYLARMQTYPFLVGGEIGISMVRKRRMSEISEMRSVLRTKIQNEYQAKITMFRAMGHIIS